MTQQHSWVGQRWALAQAHWRGHTEVMLSRNSAITAAAIPLTELVEPAATVAPTATVPANPAFSNASNTSSAPRAAPVVASPAPLPSLVPIRTLVPRHRARVAAHLLALSPADRYLRFGYAAGDAQIQHYVDGLDFTSDDILGIFDRRLQLIAMAHTAYSREPKTAGCAEFGVAVRGEARGRGLGGLLFERAVLLARNRGVNLLFIHALTENTAMLRIARKAGALVERDGTESDAYLRLPPASIDTHLTAMLARQMAEVDYRLKVQAQHFRQWLEHRQQTLRSTLPVPPGPGL